MILNGWKEGMTLFCMACAMHWKISDNIFTHLLNVIRFMCRSIGNDHSRDNYKKFKKKINYECYENKQNN